MPTGIQIWDELGRLTVDLTDRLTQYIGSVYINPGTSGSLNVPGVDAGNQVWAFFLTAGLSSETVIYTIPTITISGATISWSGTPSYQGLPAYGGTLIYGRY